MNKEFIPYEQALELKELGFDEGCLARYFEDGKSIFYTQSKIFKDCIPAPLYQQAFRWFREKYEVFNSIYPIGISTGGKDSYRWRWVILGIMEQENVHQDESDIGYLKYEEAELACLKRLIQIAKNK